MRTPVIVIFLIACITFSKISVAQIDSAKLVKTEKQIERDKKSVEQMDKRIAKEQRRAARKARKVEKRENRIARAEKNREKKVKKIRAQEEKAEKIRKDTTTN